MAEKPSSLPKAGEILFGFNRQARDPTEARGAVAAFCTFLATGASLRMGRTWNFP